MTESSFPSLKSLSLSQGMCLTLVTWQLLKFCNSLPSKSRICLLSFITVDWFVLFLNPTEKLQDVRGAFYMQRPLSTAEHQAGKILRQSRGVHEDKENLKIQQKWMQERAQRQPVTEMQQRDQNCQSQLREMQQREENLQRELNEMQQCEKRQFREKQQRD